LKPKHKYDDLNEEDIDVVNNQYDSKLRNPYSYTQHKEALPIRSSLTGEWKTKKEVELEEYKQDAMLLDGISINDEDEDENENENKNEENWDLKDNEISEYVNIGLLNTGKQDENEDEEKEEDEEEEETKIESHIMNNKKHETENKLNSITLNAKEWEFKKKRKNK